MKSFTAKWLCPNCRSEIEWTGQIVDQYKRDPRPGDNFLCVECSAVSKVTSDDRLRLMTEAEFMALRPASRKIIRKAQTDREHLRG